MRLRVCASIEIEVDVSGFESTIDRQDVCAAVDAAIADTGATVLDVVEWKEVTDDE